MYNSDSEYDGGEDSVYSFGVRPSRNNSNSDITAIKVMLQQQQAMSTSILANQDEIQRRQDLYEQKVTKLEEYMVERSALTSSSDGSPSSGRKRKRIVSRGISVSVACVFIVL